MQPCTDGALECWTSEKVLRRKWWNFQVGVELAELIQTDQSESTHRIAACGWVGEADGGQRRHPSRSVKRPMARRATS